MSSSSHCPKSHVKLRTSSYLLRTSNSISSKSQVMRKTTHGAAVTPWKAMPITCAPSLTLLENNSKRARCSLKEIIRRTWHRICKRSLSLSSRSQWMLVRSCSKLSCRATIRCRSQGTWGSKRIMACLILLALSAQQFKDLWTCKRGNTPIRFRMEQLGRTRAWSTLRKWTQHWLATISKTIVKFLRWRTTCSRTLTISTRWRRICDLHQWWTIQWQATCSICRARTIRCSRNFLTLSTSTC